MKRCLVFLLALSFLFLASCGSSGKSAQPSPDGTSHLQQQSGVQMRILSKPSRPSKPPSRIVMGWNAFGTTDTYIQQSSVSPVLNTVAPEWFSLDRSQLVANVVDPRYVDWAHSKGKQVWPLLGNRFDVDLTNYILSDKTKRTTVISTLRQLIVQNAIDGINVDFENIDIKNKQDYVTFIKELTAALRPNGRIVSVDVSRENPDPNWSGSFDRRALGQAADFIVMMGYDEDLGWGGKIGSVASIPWVEQGLQLLLKDVPASKVILAIPFYTRDWVTNLSTGQSYRIDMTASDLKQLIEEKGLVKKWDPKSKLNYVEYTENGEKHQIWVEDENSVKLRMDLVRKYKLKGVAAWVIGQEPPELWPILRK